MASIINTTSGTAGTITSTAATLINELKGQFLGVSLYDDTLEQQLFVPDPVTGQAKTKQWNRIERLPVETSPSQLTEGVAADAVGLTINSVTATMEEYGKAIQISRLAVRTSSNDLVQGTIKTLGLHHKELRDRLIYAIANAATSVFRVNDRANDNAQAVGDYLSYEEIVDVESTLDAAGAVRWPNGNYRLVAPSQMHAKLKTDPNWLALNQFQGQENVRKGYIGTLAGVDVFKTNSTSFTATASTTSGNSSKIRSGFIAGPEWAKVSNLQEVEFNVAAPGQGADTQKRRYEFSYTTVFKSVIVNQTQGYKIRASCSDATAV